LFEEFRTGRKELAFETMYKRKIKGSEQLNTPPLLTSKTTPFYQNQPDKQADFSIHKVSIKSSTTHQRIKMSGKTYRRKAGCFLLHPAKAVGWRAFF
jgi:hypothetical protein